MTETMTIETRNWRRTFSTDGATVSVWYEHTWDSSEQMDPEEWPQTEPTLQGEVARYVERRGLRLVQSTGTR